MPTLVAGLGNPILSDDGVGWVVAQKVAETISNSDQNLRIESFSLAGISLMEQLIGFDRVVIIDSLNTGKYPQGEIIHFTLDIMEDLTFGHSASAHDLSLKKALTLGRSMDVKLPEDKDVHILAIEARHVFEFSETLTPAIQAAVPVATRQILALLQLWNTC